jgi:dTDP-4-amino-4,6-dideoxygalactose transaminase
MEEPIQFVDLRAQHDEVREEIDRAISALIDSSAFIGGQHVADFESAFAAYVGTREAVAVANGTDALWLALEVAGVRAGDAVITAPNTFIATAEAMTRLGAVPLFVDVDPVSFNLDPQELRALLEEQCWQDDSGQVIHQTSGRRIGAIVPVHLYGMVAEMGSIRDIAQAYGIPIVEDACQAHGARYWLNGAWQRAGTFGVAAAFSFYPSKNLGAMGDAGAVVTDDPEAAQYMRWLRDHGSSERYVHPLANGWNSRLDAMQAAVLTIKLRHLDRWNEQRRAAASYYREVLANLPLQLPAELPRTEHVYHLFIVRLSQRERLRHELQRRGIGTGIHYPIPLHLQKAYAYLGLGPGTYPHAESSARTILSLPMHPHLRREHVERVGAACAAILTAVNRKPATRRNQKSATAPLPPIQPPAFPSTSLE